MARQGIFKRMRKQDAVYWSPLPVDHHGQKTYSEPVQIKVRWDDETTQFLDANGNTQTSKSTVYCGPLSEAGLEDGAEIALLGVLWQGKMEDLTNPSDPFANPGAYEIRAIQRSPDLKAKRLLRIAKL